MNRKILFIGKLNEATSQLEDLKKDAQSHISDDEPSSIFKDNVEALQVAIVVLKRLAIVALKRLDADYSSTSSIMKRYTRVLETGKIYPTHGVNEALKQLAAYENTGFTPEQIEKLKKELYLTGKYWNICLPTK